MMVDLDADRGLGVDPLVGDPRQGAAHQPRVLEHLQIGVEQVAELFAARFRYRGPGLPLVP